jgi:hypothetical protein
MDNSSRCGHFLEIVTRKTYRRQVQIRRINTGYEAAIGMAETTDSPYSFSLVCDIMMYKLSGCDIGSKVSRSQQSEYRMIL